MAEKQEQQTESPKPTQQGLKELIETIDPNKLAAIVGAIVTPFQSATRQARKEVLFVTSGIVAFILIALLILALLRLTDASSVVFAFGTALGYVFGFLSRFLIRD